MQKQKGFTIVELLIVVVVIAILAAITIVAYNGISQRAKASTAQSSAQQAAKKLATFAIDNGDTYPANLASIGIVNSDSTTYQYSVNTSTTPHGYCVTATTGGVSYFMGSNYAYTGSTSGTINQSTPAEGACPGQSSSGNSVVNIVANPSAEAAQSGYGRPGNAALTLTTAQAHSGTRSGIATLPVSMSAGTAGMSFYGDTGLSALKPNTTYVASAYVYVPAATGAIRLAVQSSPSGGLTATNNSEAFANSGSTKGQWVRLRNTFTTAASAGTITFYLLNHLATGSGATTDFYADSFMVTEGTTLYEYADGDSPGWVWSGTAGLSSSSGPAL